jgi:hypothetical protein
MKPFDLLSRIEQEIHVKEMCLLKMVGENQMSNSWNRPKIEKGKSLKDWLNGFIVILVIVGNLFALKIQLFFERNRSTSISWYGG